MFYPEKIAYFQSKPRKKSTRLKLYNRSKFTSDEKKNKKQKGREQEKQEK